MVSRDLSKGYSRKGHALAELLVTEDKADSHRRGTVEQC